MHSTKAPIWEDRNWLYLPSLECLSSLHSTFPTLLDIFHILHILISSLGFPHGSDGKESACNQETQVQSLGWEDPLEKKMATHPSIIA